MILSIDPGRKPGYILLDPRTLVPRKHLPDKPETPLVCGVWLSFTDVLGEMSFRPRRIMPRVPPIDSIVSEGQHGGLTTEKRNGVLTLADIGGWQRCRACAILGGSPYVLHPQRRKNTERPGWRDGLRCAGCTKAVLQRRIQHSLIPAEAALFACASASRLSDCLDGTGIGWGFWLLRDELTPWKEPP